MLTPQERGRFEAAVQDDDPSQARAQALFDKLIKEQQITSPWWEKASSDKNNNKPSFNNGFIKEAMRLASQSAKAKTAKIEYNIIAVLLAYAFIVRHCDVHSLQEIHSKKVVDILVKKLDDDDDILPLEPFDRGANDDEEIEALRDVTKQNLAQFAPFLGISGDASKIVLESIEQVTLSFATAWVHQEAALATSEVRCIVQIWLLFLSLLNLT